MNIKELKEIIAVMQENGLTELELEKNGFKVKLKKSPSGFEIKNEPTTEWRMPAVDIPQSQAPEKVEKEPEGVVVVRSPMVGTFYAAPAPDKEPYVSKGKAIKEGDVLCIVEAMKLMNEIKSEVSGQVIEILVSNGQPVEFDQPLFKIQKA